MPEDLTRRLRCPDCAFEFRRLGGAPSAGLRYVERWCQGCEETKLVVLRGRDLVGVGRLFGRDRIGLRDTLRQLDGLQPDERQAILRDALAAVRRPGGRPPPDG